MNERSSQNEQKKKSAAASRKEEVNDGQKKEKRMEERRQTSRKEKKKNKEIRVFFYLRKEVKAHNFARNKERFFGKKWKGPLENGKVSDEKGRLKVYPGNKIQGIKVFYQK